MAKPVKCLLLVFMVAVLNISMMLADLPQELDPFLEKLFETPECESFLSEGTLLAVATRECPPFQCDFPRQLCMRPSGQYQQESANQCKDLPEQCLLAANGGKPLTAPSTPPPLPSTNGPLPTRGHVVNRLTTAAVPVVNTARPPPPVPGPQVPVPICEQGPPEGRFCGFSLKFAYNRETRSCDQFWFPGCRTERTNQNLFDTLQECLQAVRHCQRGEPIFRPQPAQGQVPVPAPPPDLFGPSPGQPPPQPPVQPRPAPVDTPFGQAGQFIRLITNTIREVRERGAGGQPAGGQQGGGGAFRWDPGQLGGLLQSLGGKRR